MRLFWNPEIRKISQPKARCNRRPRGMYNTPYIRYWVVHIGRGCILFVLVARVFPEPQD